MDENERNTENNEVIPKPIGRRMRNWRFDYLKGICCIVVILSHCPAPGIVGDAIIYGCKFAVPIFFMITGYYMDSKNNEWIFNKIKQLLIKLIIAELLYGVWGLFVHIIIDNRDFGSFISSMSILNHPIKVFFCGTLFNGVFWYFYGIIWSYLLIVLLRKVKIIYSNAFCIAAVAILLTVHIVGRFVLQNRIDYSQYVYLTRNGLLFGFPLVLTGMLFSRYEKTIREKVSCGKNIALLFLGGAVLVAEYIFSRQYLDFHYSSFIISCAMFMFAFTYKKDGIVFKNPLSFMGQNLSLWIYLDHMFVDQFLKIVAEKLSLADNVVYGYLHTLLVIIMSIVMAYVIYIIKKHRYEKKNRE